MSNASFNDFRENFPDSYRIRVASYWEDYANYENGYKPIPMRWTKSRNTVKKSAKKTAAARNMHKIEQSIFDSEIKIASKKQTLVIPIRWESEIFAYAKTDIGEFCLEFDHKRLAWRASWHGKHAWNPNPFKALAKLLGQEWGENTLTGKKLSIYSLFSGITFDYGQKPNVRNRTRTIPKDLPKEFRMIWHTKPKMPQNPAWTPPASPKKNQRIVFPSGMEGEKSRL